MKIVIVGRKNGKRQVRWPVFLTLGVTLALAAGLASGGFYFLLSGRWSHSAAMYGAIVAMGVVTWGFYSGLTAPLERLPELPAKKKPQ